MKKVCSECKNEIAMGDLAMGFVDGKATYWCSACFKRLHPDWEKKINSVKDEGK